MVLQQIPFAVMVPPPVDEITPPPDADVEATEDISDVATVGATAGATNVC